MAYADLDLDEERRRRAQEQQAPQPDASTPVGSVGTDGPWTPPKDVLTPDDIARARDAYSASQSGGSADDVDRISALYRDILGRDVDPGRELESEIENLGKYGLGQLEQNLRERAAPTSHRPYDSQTTNANEMRENAIADAQRGTSAPGRLPMPGQVPFGDFEFDDASTRRLENIGAAQLVQIRSNPALNQLLDYLQQQFTQRSQTPGFTPEELAVLRTQAFEPVEDYRQASKDRARQRAAQAGFLPTSGIHEIDLRDIDKNADRTRTQLDRDLSIANIDRRRQDQTEAQRIAQLLGLTIPQGQRAEELNVAQMLYQLPRNALQDVLAVVNGSSSPNDAFNQSLQLQQQRDRERAAQEARDAAFWGQIADLFSRLFS